MAWTTAATCSLGFYGRSSDFHRDGLGLWFRRSGVIHRDQISVAANIAALITIETVAPQENLEPDHFAKATFALPGFSSAMNKAI